MNASLERLLGVFTLPVRALARELHQGVELARYELSQERAVLSRAKAELAEAVQLAARELRRQ